MLNTLLSQLAKNMKDLPGWVPLLVLCYGAFQFWDIRFVNDPSVAKTIRDAIALLVAFVGHGLGDAVDKAMFTSYAKRRLESYRREARRVLNIEAGTYRVSKSLALAARFYIGSAIQVRNEGAKLLRSMGSILVPGGLLVLGFGEHVIGTILIIVGMVLFPVSFYLKATHMKMLYELLQELTCSKEYAVHTLEKNICLFFWDGELVASGKYRSTENV